MAPKTVKAPLAPKRFERQLAEFTTFMINEMHQRYTNQAIGGLQVNTVEKFQDAKQIGNYSAIYLTLANRVRRKLMKQFSNKRLTDKGTEFFQKVNRDNQQRVYAPVSSALGIDTAQLIAKEALKPDVNALIAESVQWIKKLRDDTLESFTASTLRGMSLGQSLEQIMSDFKGETNKRKNHAEFIARNQVSSFNAMTSKIRHQKLGITDLDAKRLRQLLDIMERHHLTPGELEKIMKDYLKVSE